MFESNIFTTNVYTFFPFLFSLFLPFSYQFSLLDWYGIQSLLVLLIFLFTFIIISHWIWITCRKFAFVVVYRCRWCYCYCLFFLHSFFSLLFHYGLNYFIVLVIPNSNTGLIYLYFCCCCRNSFLEFSKHNSMQKK